MVTDKAQVNITKNVIEKLLKCDDVGRAPPDVQKVDAKMGTYFIKIDYYRYIRSKYCQSF